MHHLHNIVAIIFHVFWCSCSGRGRCTATATTFSIWHISSRALHWTADGGNLLVLRVFGRSMLNYYCGNRPNKRNPSPGMTLVVHDLITMQLVAVIVVHVCLAASSSAAVVARATTPSPLEAFFDALTSCTWLAADDGCWPVCSSCRSSATVLHSIRVEIIMSFIWHMWGRRRGE